MPDTIAEVAARHGFSADAARVIAEALRHGGGGMAQFDHPELGGMGQWTAGGMIMIGEMSNADLKARVAALCRDLAAAPGPVPAAAQAEPAPDDRWWPRELGAPAASGSQNGLRYACFPAQRRLAVMRDGRVRLYDTGSHRLNGFSQAQSTTRDLAFSSQAGIVRLNELAEVG